MSDGTRFARVFCEGKRERVGKEGEGVGVAGQSTKCTRFPGCAIVVPVERRTDLGGTSKPLELVALIHFESSCPPIFLAIGVRHCPELKVHRDHLRSAMHVVLSMQLPVES